MSQTFKFPIAHGGTRPKPCSELRSPVLRDQGPRIAAECLQRIEQTWPELRQHYGERGWRLTAEDNLWHINFLDTAANLNDPEYLHRYADWLVRFLGPRGLCPDHIAGVFGFLAERLSDAEIPPDQEPQRQQLVALLEGTLQHVRSGSA